MLLCNYIDTSLNIHQASSMSSILLLEIISVIKEITAISSITTAQKRLLKSSGISHYLEIEDVKKICFIKIPRGGGGGVAVDYIISQEFQ